MFGLVCLGGGGIDRARAFKEAVRAPPGPVRIADCDADRSSARRTDDPGPHRRVTRPFGGGAAWPGNGATVGCLATSRARVGACCAAAPAQGGTPEGPPGLRPDHGPGCFDAGVRDPDGTKAAAVPCAGGGAE